MYCCTKKMLTIQLLNYAISLCHVREIHISSYETRCKARPYLKEVWNTCSQSHFGSTGADEGKVDILLPFLSEHRQRVQGALCYSSFWWPLVQKSKWKKAALFKCREVQKINGKLSNKRTGLIMALLMLLK